MPKINPFSLRPAADVTETRTFTDPNQPDTEIKLTFTSQSGADMAGLLGDRIEANTKRYLTGTGKEEPPVPIVIPGARAITMSERLIRSVSMFQEMERPQEGDEVYSFEEWVAIGVTMPVAFRDITNWAVDLQNRTGETAGNE